MKTFFKCTLLIVLSIIFVLPINCLAVDDVEYTSDTIVSSNNARVTGLIYKYALGIEKDGSIMRIAATTYGTTDVVKAGLKNITIQRRTSSSASWVDYYDCGNYYEDSTSAIYAVSYAVPSGYQYRVSLTHYAKKNILMVEKIDNTSNILTF